MTALFTAWLVRRFGAAAAARIQSALWVLLAITLVVAFWTVYAVVAYRYGVSVERTRGAQQALQLALQHERALSDQRARSLKLLNESVAIAEELRDHVDRLAKARQTTVRTIIKRIPDVTTLYVPSAGAALEPLPACLFTAGYRRLWNAALEADRLRAAADSDATGVDVDPRAAADSAAAGSTDPAPAEPAAAAELAIAAGVTPAALLENHTLNAERCAGIEDSRAALIVWLRDVRAAHDAALR